MTQIKSDTSQKRIKTLVEREKDLLETTLKSAGDGMISTDGNGKIVFLNRVAELLTGWTQEQAKGKSFHEVFHIINEFTRKPCESVVEKVLESRKTQGLPSHTILVSKNGTERAIEDSAAPIMRENGEIIGVVLIFRDFTEQKQKQDEMLYLSYHDQLTGLYNRRFYEQEIVRLDVEKNLPLTLIMGDVNGLKLVNDFFGHRMGDELLKKAAEGIRCGCRTNDIIIRVGGDEFVILLPKTEAAAAEQIIERIHEQILHDNINGIELSISFGHETKNTEKQEIREIYENAEKNMYKNKLRERTNPEEESVCINKEIMTKKIVRNSNFRRLAREIFSL